MAKFVLAGRTFDLKKEDIFNAVKGVEPLTVHDFTVNLNGKKYPIKHALSLVTLLSTAKFSTSEAHGILRKLGFNIENVFDEDRKRKERTQANMRVVTKWVG
jgi:hypothetical protein